MLSSLLFVLGVLAVLACCADGQIITSPFNTLFYPATPSTFQQYFVISTGSLGACTAASPCSLDNLMTKPFGGGNSFVVTFLDNGPHFPASSFSNLLSDGLIASNVAFIGPATINTMSNSFKLDTRLGFTSFVNISFVHSRSGGIDHSLTGLTYGLSLENVDFSAATGDGGGGVEVSIDAAWPGLSPGVLEAPLYVTQSTFSNTSGTKGGGLAVNATATTIIATATIENSTFLGTYEGKGAAIFIDLPVAPLVSSTVTLSKVRIRDAYSSSFIIYVSALAFTMSDSELVCCSAVEALFPGGTIPSPVYTSVLVDNCVPAFSSVPIGVTQVNSTVCQGAITSTTTTTTTTDSTTTTTTSTMPTTSTTTTTDSTTTTTDSTTTTTDSTTTTTDSTTTTTDSTTTTTDSTTTTTDSTTTTTDSTTTTTPTTSTTTTPTTSTTTTPTTPTTIPGSTTVVSSTTTRPTTTTTTTTTTTPPPTTTTTTTDCIDSDGDGVSDCQDECPNNANLTRRTQCGCAAAEACICQVTACPPVYVPENSTVWTLPANSTHVVLNVSSGNLTLVFELGWGRICEVRSDGTTVKCVDPVRDGWLRTAFVNASRLAIFYSSTNSSGPAWTRPPFAAELSTVITLNDTMAAAKFSLVVAAWPFASREHLLRVEFTAEADFDARVKCGEQQRYELTTSSDELAYRFFTSNRTAFALSMLRHADVDGQRRGVVAIGEPVFTSGAVSISVDFPSFGAALDYDPNFALLLGYGTSTDCSKLLSWILPAAFLAGAACIIVLFIALSYVPAVRPLMLGEEGLRIQNLREFIKRNEIDEEDAAVHHPTAAADSDWN